MSSLQERQEVSLLPLISLLLLLQVDPAKALSDAEKLKRERQEEEEEERNQRLLQMQVGGTHWYGVAAVYALRASFPCS
jgi:hypothetical protein